MTTSLTDHELEEISAWLDGETSEPAAREMSAKVVDDPLVGQTVAAYREIDAEVRAFARAHAAEPSLSLLAAVQAGFARRRHQERSRGWMRAAMPFAASLVLLIGGSVWMEHRVAERLANAKVEAGHMVAAAVQQALETMQSGQAVTFGGADAPVAGTVTPVRTYRSKTRHWCREFEESVMISGEAWRRSGVACREPNGGWRRVGPNVSG